MAETNTRITFAVAQPWVGVSVTRCPCWTTLGKQTKLLCASDSSCVKRREKVPNLKESRSKRAQRACRGLGPGSEPSITFTTTATNYYALNNSWLLLLVTLFPFPVLSHCHLPHSLLSVPTIQTKKPAVDAAQPLRRFLGTGSTSGADAERG